MTPRVDRTRLAIVGVGVAGMTAILLVGRCGGDEPRRPGVEAGSSQRRIGSGVDRPRLGDDGIGGLEDDEVVEGGEGAAATAIDGGSAPYNPYELQVEAVPLPAATDPAALRAGAASAVTRDSIPADVASAARAAGSGQAVRFAVVPGGSGSGARDVEVEAAGPGSGGPKVLGTTTASTKPPPGDGAGGEVGAGLPKEIVRRVIRRHLPDIRGCYERALADHPGLQGTVTAVFTIDLTGAVSASHASGVHADVARCVAGVIRAIEFPRPDGHADVQVRYPFVFRAAPASSP